MKPPFLNGIRSYFRKKKDPTDIFPLVHNLPLPQGFAESRLFNFLKTVLVEDAPPKEMENYCLHDFKRFLLTYGLVQDCRGKCLELGANPYFTTMLLFKFTKLDLSLANYFGPDLPENGSQRVRYLDIHAEEYRTIEMKYSHFNIEKDRFPFGDGEFDVVLFCEIIEHLLMDPVSVLLEIKRILKPKGFLVLTTPNAGRLENVARIISGFNIYDPYSGYGPYGRHNREYTKHELFHLLLYLGFDVDVMFSADVHANTAQNYTNIFALEKILKRRENDLGQYIFIRATNNEAKGVKKPDFLFRSYPPDQLEPYQI
jgi:SAM-dependent methyltransferase